MPSRAAAPPQGARRPRARALDGARRRLRGPSDPESARAELFEERIEAVRRYRKCLGAPLDRARVFGLGGDDRRGAAARRVLLRRCADARRHLSRAAARERAALRIGPLRLSQSPPHRGGMCENSGVRQGCAGGSGGRGGKERAMEFKRTYYCTHMNVFISTRRGEIILV